MNAQSQIIILIIIFLTIISLLSVYQYDYINPTEFFPILIPGNSLKWDRIFVHRNQSTTDNHIRKYIDQCPECFLFLLLNKKSIQNEVMLNILNNIPSQSEAIFYPLTMTLFYNQPIPFYTILAKNQTEIMIQTRQYWIDHIEKFPNIQSTFLLDFILQSLKKPISSTNYSWSNQTKLILYYTKFFGSTYWYNSNAQEVYSNDLNIDNCPLSVNACHITIDRNLFSKSDASLIHLRESINYNKLNNLSRRTDQRLIFFLKESPVHSPVLSSKKHGHLFNYTQTYRPDSDITATTLRTFFWLFDWKIYPNYDFQSILKTKQTGKLLVAIISNCGGSSNRLKYIEKLRNYISVDVYGQCGKICPSNVDCRQENYSKYKFYLAFENSLCDEYVTEKFFLALHSARIVPIVLGYARYHHYIPSNGYIDVRNYSSPRQLAEYINYLDQNTTAYLEYFHWRQYALHIKLPKYMCELCLKLFLDDRDHKQQALEHIDQYWNPNTQCHSYMPDKNGIWTMR